MAGSALQMETQPEFERESDMGRPSFGEQGPHFIFQSSFYTLSCAWRIRGKGWSHARTAVPGPNQSQAFKLIICKSKHLSTFQPLFPLLLYGSLNDFSCDYRLNDRTLGFWVCGRFQFVLPFCLALPCLDSVCKGQVFPQDPQTPYFYISSRP